MTAEPSPYPRDLDIIGSFLSALDQPVAGHAREALTAEQMAELEALALGELDAPRRNQLIPLLSRNEVAIEYLTGLLKLQQNEPPVGDAES